MASRGARMARPRWPAGLATSRTRTSKDPEDGGEQRGGHGHHKPVEERPGDALPVEGGKAGQDERGLTDAHKRKQTARCFFCKTAET